ncbi:coiled-coil domain-containing protein 40 [Ctenocephalides felis]|uniref:coiled-coil domain-containing protein 40 n=1 Tax=Ctenocephalides felis TaxID=7515 RepID=UPI000E6E345D|nr:coiled-coil domain-containing protein 40 [Ctenocephalides felis]
MINQRIADKDRLDKQKLIDEQKQLDLIMYNLTSEIEKLESEKNMLEVQIEKLNGKIDFLEQNISNANADYQTLHKEKNRLLQLWSGVVINIQQRDNLLINCRRELKEQEERVRSKTIDLMGYKKKTQMEMEENEALMLQKTRAEYDLSSAQRQVHNEMTKIESIDREMNQLKAAIDLTEKELTKATYEVERIRQINGPLQSEVDKHARIKVEIEEEMMTLLKDQITNDKAAQYLAKMYHEKQHKSRSMEIVLNTQENQLAQITLNIENWRSMNSELQGMLNALTKEYNEAEKYVNSLTEEHSKNQQLQSRRQRTIDTLNKKLESLVEATGHTEGESELDMKAQELEKSIRNAEEKTHKLEIIWLRMQSHVVTLATKHSDQQELMHNLRRQLIISEHRSVKLNKEVNALQNEDQNLTKRINNIVARLQVVNAQLLNKRGCKADSMKQCELTQVEFSKKLLDSETNCAHLEQEINDLENDIIELESLLMAKQKEVLSWDGLVRHAVENIQSYKAEMKEGSDLIGMKTEIHRMQVRLANLKQISDKLLHDLDNCVNQRESIVDKAEVRDKKGDSDKSRMKLNAKIEETKIKIKKAKKQLQSLENKNKNIEDEQNMFLRDLEDIKSAQKLQDIEEAHLDEEIMYCQLIKAHNTERIILKQHRAKKIAQLQDHHIQQLSMRNDSIAASLDHQNKMNNNLVEICHVLKESFPQYKHQLNRILNTLKKRETVCV